MDKVFYFFIGGLCSFAACYWFVDSIIDDQQELIEKQDILIKGLIEDNDRLLLKLADCAMDKSYTQDSIYEANSKEAELSMLQAIKLVEQLAE